MYMDNKWAPMMGTDLSAFLEQITPIDGRYTTDSATTQVGTRTLPFYDSVELIRVKDPSWEPGNLFIYYLRDSGILFRLNGTSPPLHEVNAKAPIKINERNVIDYLEFFCFFVRGEEGPFLIVQSMADTYVPKQLDVTTSTVMEGTLRPATFEGVNEQGHYLCDAVVYYSNAIFITNFTVHPTGMVEMLDDEPIAADLPQKISAPVS
ncbi:hypothetical protein [Pelagibius sp. Alg239-R121]|uniref:hypothetical protein n=1 Tax=Pelagibius sp. Alg239-R121 TaxID=2993448 RepID=UPI0024A6E79E|nr:hypothetical protein [Pelagibius sp. Alg239-R121]